MNKSPTVKQQLLQQNIRPGLAKLPLPEGERMALTKKHTSVFTLIRPAATFSLREKESSRPPLAKREAPAGRHEIARGVSPGYGVPKKSIKPRRGGTKPNTDGQDKQGIFGRGGTRPSRPLAKLPLPAGEGRGEGERRALTKKHTTVFTLIRPAATFSLREKESSRPPLAKREAPAGERNNVMRHRVAPLNRRINEPSASRQK